jgi:hypothetical protein
LFLLSVLLPSWAHQADDRRREIFRGFRRFFAFAQLARHRETGGGAETSPIPLFHRRLLASFMTPETESHAQVFSPQAHAERSCAELRQL